MTQKDILKDWFKDLPKEQTSSDYTRKVMEQVMQEWSLNPVKYQPIISKKAWWTIGGMAFIMTTILFMMHSTVSNATDPASQQTFWGLDLNSLLTPFNHYFSKLNDISPAVAIGVLAIIALWFFDQLIARSVRR